LNKAKSHGPIFSPEGSEIQEIFDSLPFYVMLIDDRHHILMANKAVRSALGVDPAQIIGQYCPKIIHGLDHPFPGCPLEEAVEKGGSAERELFDPAYKRWLLSCAYPTSLSTIDDRPIYVHISYDITAKKEAEAELRRNVDFQTVVSSLLLLALEDLDLSATLTRSLDEILSLSWLAFEKRGALFLVDQDSENLVMAAQSGLSNSISESCARVPFGRCLCGRTALRKIIHYAEDLDDRHEVRYPGIAPHGHYCLPIMRGGRLLGVLTIYLKPGHSRNKIEEDFLAAIANTLAGIIIRKNTEDLLKHSYEDLKQTLEGMIQALSSTVTFRDPYTAGHQSRVTKLAVAIAGEMNLPSDRIQGLHTAGLLHDIGKINVPAEILSKPGRLNDYEFQLIQTHVQAGYDILKSILFPWPVAQIARQHHERLDGSGYPCGLTRDEILLEARILAVADVVEAMASHRPYRPGLGIDKTLVEIAKNSGILYDPDVVKTCLKLIQEKGFEFDDDATTTR
jgi:putative nucleotidyltransferase with HDIG domain/PAS domain S-box-containing protein